MDTFFEINSPEKCHWDEIEKEIQERINHLDLLLNSYNPKSEVSLINQNAGIQPVPISLETYTILLEAVEFCQVTGGLFDITFQPFQDLYGFETGAYHVPDSQEILETQLLIGYSSIVFDETIHSVYLPRIGMKINCSGFIKGKVLDHIQLLLNSKGILNYSLNFGGNLYIQSVQEEKIGIKSPYNNEIIKVVPVKTGFVSTSSNGEQFFIQDGRRYSHIVNPLDGSAASVNDSVTVISSSGFLSDCLSTYLYLLPENRAKQFILDYYPDSGFVIIRKQQIIMEKAPEF